MSFEVLNLIILSSPNIQRKGFSTKLNHFVSFKKTQTAYRKSTSQSHLKIEFFIGGFYLTKCTAIGFISIYSMKSSNRRKGSKNPKQSSSRRKSNTLQCNGCNQIFSSKAQLIKHIKFSSNQKCNDVDHIHSCHICGKQFVTEKTLLHHMRSSTICNALSNPDFLSSMDIPSSNNKTSRQGLSSKPIQSNAKQASTQVIQETSKDVVYHRQQSRISIPSDTEEKQFHKTSSHKSQNPNTNVNTTIKVLKDHVQSQSSSYGDLVLDVSQFISFCEESYVRVSFDYSDIMKQNTHLLTEEDKTIVNILNHDVLL